MKAAAFALVLLLSFSSGLSAEMDERISLPTENEALFHGGGPEFYQYIEREFQGAKSTPWEGGRYGFVRNPVPTADRLIYSRFHEGIDIKPLRRDERGDPLDEVHAIADGKVVYTNATAAYSNYGRYIVLEHVWGGSPYYSLYGHLSEIEVAPGRFVHRGDQIARMGYTGEGLNQARAHLHLELNLMLSRNFEDWYAHFVPNEPNHHGLFNGINLTGIDIARFFLARERRPEVTIPEFLAEEETFYKVAVPDSPHFDLRRLYPWMVRNGEKGRSWEISFARAGVPLKIEARSVAVLQPAVTFVKNSSIDCALLTRGVVSGRGENAHLTESGLRLIKLLTWPD